MTVPYVVVVGSLMIVVVHLDRRFDLGTPLLWALAVWGLVHMAGGIVPLGDDRVLYNAQLGLDFVRYDGVAGAWLVTGSGIGGPLVVQTLTKRVSPSSP